jgi:hypothetical protein
LEAILVEDIHNTARAIIDPDIDDGRHCGMCRRHTAIFVLEKHHILPKSWGGPTTEAESARGTVWEYADGNCHNTVHLILDHMKRVGEWDEDYLHHWEFPFGPVRFAKMGWDRWVKLLEEREDMKDVGP